MLGSGLTIARLAAQRVMASVDAATKKLLSGDEQSGTDALLLSGDEQTGTDALKLSGDQS